MSGTAGDNYAIFYADKLWNLLPAAYRTKDTDQFNVGVQPQSNGPLREMVNRIGATAADLRRSIDRLWEDQSIETCDDWVIPYIAALLDTRLVSGLDPSRQRLDVYHTIDYRRRKGTLCVLEQVANDITGWDAKAVEFFRRLGRTRHGLDPPIGPASPAGTATARLQQAEGLVGVRTGTRIGGFADLRNAQGAGQSRTAFDEFFHTADTRAGQGVFGWHAIPHLGIFVWRLLSLAVGPVTPVAIAGCDRWYTFDPTGRDVPLFAPQLSANAFGDTWISPTEGQLPGPMSQALLEYDIGLGAGGLQLYPVVPRPPSPAPPPALSVSGGLPPFTENLAADTLTLRPAFGRFCCKEAPPADLVATYCYGFPSEIGAGPYDRRGQQIPVPLPEPRQSLCGGGAALLGVAPTRGTVTLGDSLTYVGASKIEVHATLTLQADNKQRPLVALDDHSAWIIEGIGSAARLVLDGMFVSGQDIVLRGSFTEVTLTCSTLDPGSAADPGAAGEATASPPGAPFQRAANGRSLRPTRLWIEARIETLTIDRCVLGPVRTRGGGTVETATISNSTLQGLRSSGYGPVTLGEVKDGSRLLRMLQLGLDPVSATLRALDPGIEALLGPPADPPLTAPTLRPTLLAPLVSRLNALIDGPPLPASAFAATPLSSQTSRLLAAAPTMLPAPELNRLLLEDAYPLELADASLAFADGSLTLSRCTVLGRLVAHQLEASECILQMLTTVDNLQGGCVRFSAWAAGSKLPRQYESVSIAQDAPLFTSTDFGQPAYAQLLATADLQILPVSGAEGAVSNTISAGATDGSEMGAYARDKNPIRARALLLKLQEYMPAALVPVIVDVT